MSEETIQTGVIHCGDNLEALSKLPDKSVDLIYADPPFFSNKHYEVIWNDGAEIRAFEDRWQGGIEYYIGWMKLRLAQCHRVLKDTGSMYLHCDWHANAHLRIEMDKIFGASHFQNEIIWHYRRWTAETKRFQRMHDTILFYEKSNHIFNSPIIPYTESSDKDYEKGYHTRVKNGETTILQKGKGVIANDVWFIQFLNPMSNERIGYPTQKPEALLKRIVEASSNKGDIILDPFCGCGTTIAVAQQLDRQWVGIDISPTACRMMKDRLNKLGVVATLINMPTTIDELKIMEPFAFQDWVINKIGGTVSGKKVNDKGIDGWTFLQHKPVQVKQSENVGRNVVDNFETAIRRAGYKEGFIYAFSFGKGAIEEVARVKSKEDLDIQLIKVEAL